VTRTVRNAQWKSGHPKNTQPGANCIAAVVDLQKVGLVDEPCNNEKQFICEVFVNVLLLRTT